MGVTVRPFEARDFERVKAFIPLEWLCQGCAPGEVEAHRNLVIAEEMVLSTYRMVAEEDGCVLGLSLGRPCGTAPDDAAHWHAVMEQAQATLRAGTPEARAAAEYEASLPRTQAALKAQAGARMSEDNEYTLFFVSPEARGKGVGGALLARWEETLRGRDARSYYLFTDSTCTYEWYDRHGFERIAELHEALPAPADPEGEPKGLGDEPEDFASFLYRRDL